MVRIFLILLLVGASFAQDNPFIISPEEAYKLLNKRDVIFVYTEDKQSFEREHIKGSVNIDSLYLQDIAIKNNEKQKCNYLPICPETAKIIFSEKGISNDKKVIIYYSKVPHKATYLWFVLYSMGFPEENLKILDGGIKMWKEVGFKTVSGRETELKKARGKSL